MEEELAIVPIPEREVGLVNDDNCDECVDCEVALPCIEAVIEVKVSSKTSDITLRCDAGSFVITLSILFQK